MTPLSDERFNHALAIGQTYLESHEGTLPPMIIGFTRTGEYLALLGTFRDFQEQLTFCSIARMAFVLHNIAEYYVLTHGDMTDTTNGKNAITKQEVVMAAGVTSDAKRGKVFRVNRSEGKIDGLHFEMEFDTDTDGIEGMFMNILPEKEAILPENIRAGVQQFISQIRYIAPEIPIEQESIIEAEPETPNAITLLQSWQTS